jgi:hypothetical protein
MAQEELSGSAAPPAPPHGPELPARPPALPTRQSPGPQAGDLQLYGKAGENGLLRDRIEGGRFDLRKIAEEGCHVLLMSAEMGEEAAGGFSHEAEW